MIHHCDGSDLSLPDLTLQLLQIRSLRCYIYYRCRRQASGRCHSAQMRGAIPPVLCYPSCLGFPGSFLLSGSFELFVCLSHAEFIEAAQGAMHYIYHCPKMKA